MKQFISLTSSLSKSLLIECKVIQCILCLDIEHLLAANRLKIFANHDNLKQSFHRKHLRHHLSDQFIACSLSQCDDTLNDTMHLQNYVEVMHKAFCWSSLLRTNYSFPTSPKTSIAVFIINPWAASIWYRAWPTKYLYITDIVCFDVSFMSQRIVSKAVHQK